jgi:hypothetical protein
MQLADTEAGLAAERDKAERDKAERGQRRAVRVQRDHDMAATSGLTGRGCTS